MKHYTSRGLSIPSEMLEKIDSSRGDVPRSKFVLRLLEKTYPEVQIENKKQSEVTAAK